MQDELRRAIDTIPGFVWSALPDGHVDFLNQRWCDYTGISLDDGRGSGWQASIHPEDRAGVLAIWRSILEAGEAGETEARLRRSDGAYRWFLIRAVPLRSDSGVVLKWYGQYTDIDDRRQTEALIAGQKRLLEMVAAGSSMPVILDALCGLVEEAEPGCHCSILLVDEAGTTVRHAAAPTLPRAYMLAVDGRATATPYWGPCAMAVDRKVQVIVPDVAADTRWHACEWGQLALGLGLRACWTTPILSRAGEALGTFAIYRQTPGQPTPQQQRLTGQFTHIASIAIEHGRTAAALQESEQRLRLMADAIPEAIWLTALHPERVLYASPSFERIWGLPLAELYRNPRLRIDMVHPEDRARVLDVFSRWISSDGHGDYDIQFRIVQPSGAVRWIHERGVVIADDGGTPCRVGGISTDITGRRRADDELRQSEAFLAEAQRLSSTGSFLWRSDPDEIVWSGQTYRIYEIDPSLAVTFDLVGQRIHPEEAAWFHDLLARARAEGRDLDFEHRLLMADRSVKYLHVVARATRDTDGRLQFIGAVQDVTERRRAEDTLSRLRSELAHMARVTTLGALTASIAHEVNQPLSGIITNANTSLLMLSDEPPNVEGARETARRTLRDADRASDVIKRLRALFSKTSLATDSLDLNDAIREVIALSTRELQIGRVALRTEFASDLPAVIGDRVQLQQVVLNLILNAAEAMSGVEDRPRQLVIATLLEEGDRVRVSVRDTGPGIDIARANRLFDPFVTTKRQGMGIGLSVSRTIIEGHQGRLWVTPNDGCGVTFGFSIPREPVTRRVRSLDDPPASVPAAAPVAGSD